MVGKRVAAVIDEYRASDHPFAYSTTLLTDAMLVETQPAPGSPLEVVEQILAPHGLTIRVEAGVWLVVPAQEAERSEEPITTTTPGNVTPPVENVVVSASRYAISRDIATSKFSIDQRTIQNMPDIGEDPLRVTQRLPGAAASGASAIAHFRGGEKGDIGIMLNGQWLFDPFHIRDYQNIFSAIDARAIEGVEVFTGGFPVRYGDRMSGLVLMDSIESEKSRQTEIGLSVFNTSFLTAGRQGDSSWLFSGRRGNLDLVIDSKFGRPSYFDLFGEYAWALSPGTRISVNGLYAADKVNLVLETEPSERDEMRSSTRNTQFWVRLENQWSDTMSSSTVVSATNYTNRRDGFANDEEKMVATIGDYREIRQVGLRQDWLWTGSDKHRVQWGLHASSGKARFDYLAMADYFGLQARYENQPAAIVRDVSASPNGGSYAIYLSDRWKLHPGLIAEWGLRWDDQTYTDLTSDSQLSPRLNLLYRLGEKTELRLAVGRYFQSQPMQSLQVEDGITNYWPAQRADHVILGLQHTMANDIAWRVEVYNKHFGKVRPRFENLFDPLGLMPELQADRVRLQPSGARARGLEISVNRSTRNASWWASYTLSKVTDRINGVDELRSWDQTHALQAGAEWRGEKWTMAAATSVHTGWPTTPLLLTNDGTAIPGPRNSTRHDLFASLDVRVSRRFDVRRGSLLVFFEASNVLNRNNECCVDWDIAEDAAGNDVLERGQDYWMPFLPAVGILWEF